MFDIDSISKRYFKIKINNIEIDVEPPKLKVLKKITSLAKAKNEDAIEDLVEAVKIMLNKNKSGYQVQDELIDELDFDQLLEILTAYFKWIGEVRNSPN
ncbi:MAG: hypothetical protein K0R50_1245 [Eubacterium sp.]|jgi:hypothetical protein|nr:hypothetical protein [Eubacterium sp.]